MKRLLTLTLFGLLAISCSRGDLGFTVASKSSTMTSSVRTQAELDAANQRVYEYRQELLRQGFREVSKYTTHMTGVDSNSKEEFVLEGQYRNLKNLRVTFWTTTRVQKDEPQLAAGIDASINDEQDDRDFEELYKKVSSVVTGDTQ